MKKRFKGLLALVLAVVMMLAVQIPAMAATAWTDTSKTIDVYIYNASYGTKLEDMEDYEVANLKKDESYTYSSLPSDYNSDFYTGNVSWKLWKVNSGVYVTSSTNLSVSNNKYTANETDYSNGYYDTCPPVVTVSPEEKTFTVNFYKDNLSSTPISTVTDCTVSTFPAKAGQIAASNSLNSYTVLLYQENKFISEYDASLDMSGVYDEDFIKYTNLFSGTNNINVVFVTCDTYYKLSSTAVNYDSKSKSDAVKDFTNIILDKDKTVISQLPTKDFYTIEWNVWDLDEFGELELEGVLSNTDKLGTAKGSFFFEGITTPISYTISVYDSTGNKTTESVTINIDSASNTTLPTKIENNGYKFVYNDTTKATVTSGSEVWAQIENIGTSFDDDNAKLVAIAKEEETTTVKKEETTTAPTTTAAGETPTTTVDNTSKDVKAGSATRTVIPFVVIAFVAIIGTCVIVTKKKLKEA